MEIKMKIWILKNDLSRSPQAAFRLYACSYRKKRSTTFDDFYQETTQQSFSGKLLAKSKYWINTLLQKVKQLTVILA